MSQKSTTPDDPKPGPLPPPSPTFVHRRFELPDLNDKGAWIIKRLREERPYYQDRQLFNWMHNIVGSSEYLFVRTDHAVALAQVIREPLEPYPIIQEWFVLAEAEEFIPEAAYLYSVMHEWGRNLGADEFRIEKMTDVPRDQIKERLGKLYLREVIYNKLELVVT